MPLLAVIFESSLTISFSLLLACPFISCSDSRDFNPLNTFELNGVESRIYGGEFLLKDDVASPLDEFIEVEVIPRALITHIDTKVRGCHPRTIHFELSQSSNRFSVRLRVYREVTDRDLFQHRPDGEHLLIDGQGYVPIDEISELHFDDLPLDSSSSEDADHPQASQYRRWSLHMFQNDRRLSVTTDLYSLQTSQDLSKGTCVDRPSEERQGLLIRQELKYQPAESFMLSFIHAAPDPLSLAAQLEALVEIGADAVIVSYPLLGSSTKEQLLSLKNTLSSAQLFWMVIPQAKSKLSKYVMWREVFGSENYALDVGSIRLMMLNLNQLHLSQPQLSLISRWLNPAPFSPHLYQEIHTRALISHTPLINLRGGQELSYRPEALRVLNEMRRAHMTHQMIASSAYTDREPLRFKQLETSIFLFPSTDEDSTLLFSLTPDCVRDATGERCFIDHSSHLQSNEE